MPGEAFSAPELREIIDHYVCENGATLGAMFLRAHLKEQQRPLPEEGFDVDRFIEENLCLHQGGGGVRKATGMAPSVAQDLRQLREELMHLKSEIEGDKLNPDDFNRFATRWLDRLGIYDME